MVVPSSPALVVASLLGLALAGCGDDTAAAAGGGGSGEGGSTSVDGSSAATGGTGPAARVEELFPEAAPLPGHDRCVVTITTDIPDQGSSHTELCDPVAYGTNPPSGGPHWPRWAAFDTYDAPVPREMLVHSLEHGAIAMLHDCDDCDDTIVEAFTTIMNEHGADPRCLSGGASVARFVVAPDPALDHPVALAAWGATYVATCIDEPSLAAFVADHYGRAPEDTCAAGVSPSEVACD